MRLFGSRAECILLICELLGIAGELYRDHFMKKSDALAEKTIPADVQRQPTQRELVRLKVGAVNAGFIQVSRAYINKMNDLAQHAPSAHRVLWTLIKEMDKQNAVMISQDSLCKLTKLSSATIKRSVALLRD